MCLLVVGTLAAAALCNLVLAPFFAFRQLGADTTLLAAGRMGLRPT